MTTKESLTIRPDLLDCTVQGCRMLTVFDVNCRHGKELPACVQHIAQVLDKAYREDGDRGRVVVYLIGVAEETLVRKELD